MQSLEPFDSPSDLDLVELDREVLSKSLDFSRVLFLDFDGVLHPDAYTNETQFCYMPNFCLAMRQADPGHRVPIVVSSLWRHFHTLATIRGHFPKDIASQIVGVTPHKTIEELQSIGDWERLGGVDSKEKHRQREIMMWINGHAPGAQWLAIDDRPNYFHDNCPNLFVVPKQNLWEGGITPDVVNELIQRLRIFLSE